MQNLAISSCVDKGATFCSNQVANSVCNKAKNECYCRRGFVSIKEEEHGITCKSLLTDLKCRVDADCIHVEKSSCHPGAGYCTCPGYTTYVPQLHACRTHVNPGNDFCLTCERHKGTCFSYADEDLKQNPSPHLKASGRFGCACPDNKATLIAGVGANEDQCKARLVDIGSYCDKTHLLCRSQRAQCRKTDPSSDLSVCACPSGYIAVFQTTLRYYECFPQLSSSTLKCGSCAENKGVCYDINGDGIGDGCICPLRYSSDSASHSCSVNHVNFHCDNGYLTLCYLSHYRPPYESLNGALVDGEATVHLLGSADDINTCRLKPALSRPEDIEMLKQTGNAYIGEQPGHRFCIKVDVLNNSKNCGVRSYRLEYGSVQYETTLEILTSSSFRSMSRDLRFPITCISKEPKRKPILHQIQPVTASPDVPAGPGEKIGIGLRVLDKTNSEVLGVREGDEIKLDISMIDASGFNNAFTVEECYASNHSYAFQSSNAVEPMLIIDRGCPIQQTGFNARFITAISPGIHLQSDLFHAFRLGKLSSIFFKCLIRLCRDVTQCQPHTCDAKSLPQRRPKGISLVERWAHVEVEEKKGSRKINENRGPSLIGICTHAICLNSIQTAVLGLLLTSLMLLVLALLALLYRRHRACHLARRHLQHHCPPTLRPVHTLTNDTIVRSNLHHCDASDMSPQLTMRRLIPTPYHEATNPTYLIPTRPMHSSNTTSPALTSESSVNQQRRRRQQSTSRGRRMVHRLSQIFSGRTRNAASSNTVRCPRVVSPSPANIQEDMRRRSSRNGGMIVFDNEGHMTTTIGICGMVGGRYVAPGSSDDQNERSQNTFLLHEIAHLQENGDDNDSTKFHGESHSSLLSSPDPGSLEENGFTRGVPPVSRANDSLRTSNLLTLTTSSGATLVSTMTESDYVSRSLRPGQTLVVENRPDLCTCDHQMSERSFSPTSSQV